MKIYVGDMRGLDTSGPLMFEFGFLEGRFGLLAKPAGGPGKKVLLRELPAPSTSTRPHIGQWPAYPGKWFCSTDQRWFEPWSDWHTQHMNGFEAFGSGRTPAEAYASWAMWRMQSEGVWRLGKWWRK